MIRLLASDTEHWEDDTWVIDSTPVEPGRSRPTALVQRPRRMGPPTATAPATRVLFGGLRLHLVATPAGDPPVTFALGQPQDRRARGGEGSRPD